MIEDFIKAKLGSIFSYFFLKTKTIFTLIWSIRLIDRISELIAKIKCL